MAQKLLDTTGNHDIALELAKLNDNFTEVYANGGGLTVPVPIASGGTASTTAAAARTALGVASSGANSSITSLTGLTTPLSIAQGGTAGTTAAGARTALGLGTAAVTAATDYGTSAQGIKADTALQPIVAAAGIGAGGFAKHALVAGAVAGDVTIAGIKVGDELNEVIHLIYTTSVLTNMIDLTSEFTVGANKINNVGGTSSATNKLMVRWTKLTT